jgi:hypothetical protein
MPRYYAVRWSYGVAVDSDGDPIHTLHSFDSRRERDAWLADGPGYRTESGYREAVPASYPPLRRARRREKIYQGPEVRCGGGLP